MGLVTGLLLLPFTAPAHGFRFFLERIRDEAEAALLDEGRAFAELVDLNMRRNAGELTDGDFAAQEAALLERLSSIREYRDELLDAEAELDDDDFADAELEVEEEVS